MGLSGLIAAPALGALSDAVGARKLLFVVVILATLLTVPQSDATSYSGFVLERFLAGLMLCAMIPVMNSLVGKAVPDKDRGRAFGMTLPALQPLHQSHHRGLVDIQLIRDVDLRDAGIGFDQNHQTEQGRTDLALAHGAAEVAPQRDLGAANVIAQ